MNTSHLILHKIFMLTYRKLRNKPYTTDSEVCPNLIRLAVSTWQSCFCATENHPPSSMNFHSSHVKIKIELEEMLLVRINLIHQTNW